MLNQVINVVFGSGGRNRQSRWTLLSQHRVITGANWFLAVMLVGWADPARASWEQETNDTIASFLYKFDHASDKPLGTKADVAAIRAVILAAIQAPNPEIVGVRWVSHSAVIAKATWSQGLIGGGNLLYVLERHDRKWKIVHSYVLLLNIADNLKKG